MHETYENPKEKSADQNKVLWWWTALALFSPNPSPQLHVSRNLFLLKPKSEGTQPGVLAVPTQHGLVAWLSDLHCESFPES